MTRLVLRIKKPSLFALRLQYGMLLKGGALPTGSIRVWGGKEYVTAGPGDWRRLVGQKEHWDSSKNDR